MSSATSTDDSPIRRRDAGFEVWHIYALFSMAAAAVAVWLSKSTSPLSLVLLSGAVFAAGLTGLAVHYALTGFFGRAETIEPVGERAREVLAREKILVLRSIKELEFDRAMGKVGDADFHDMSSRLRARALALMQDLERTDAPRAAAPRPAVRPTCPACSTVNDIDAKFCKHCGGALAQA
jgi:hypothetical protein